MVYLKKERFGKRKDKMQRVRGIVAADNKRPEVTTIKKLAENRERRTGVIMYQWGNRTNSPNSYVTILP